MGTAGEIPPFLFDRMAEEKSPVDKSSPTVFAWDIHQGGPDKGLRYCWLPQRSDPLNLIQFILA